MKYLVRSLNNLRIGSTGPGLLMVPNQFFDYITFYKNIKNLFIYYNIINFIMGFNFGIGTGGP